MSKVTCRLLCAVSLSLALAGICNSQIASASELSYSENLSNFGSPNSAGQFNFSLPQFNPTNGVLQNIAIIFSSSASGTSGPPGGGGWQFGFTITGPGIPAPSPGPFNSLSDLVFLAGAGAWSSPLAGGLTIIPLSAQGYIGDGFVSIPVKYSEFGTGAANCAAVPPCARTLNATLGITYQFVTFNGTPGKADCHGKSVSALAKQFGGLNAAATALWFPGVQQLQNAIQTFCGG
jgi:hypothetical protein